MSLRSEPKTLLENRQSGSQEKDLELKHFRFLIAFACCGVQIFAAPVVAHADPGLSPAPQSPQLGQSCDDWNKLDYDPAVGQIVFGFGEWVRSVTPVGVRSIGQPCARSEFDSVMATTPDGHLIFCPSNLGSWTLYRP